LASGFSGASLASGRGVGNGVAAGVTAATCSAAGGAASGAALAVAGGDQVVGACVAADHDGEDGALAI
jgi:hypothetical protein